jgi:hypothetical protein
MNKGLIYFVQPAELIRTNRYKIGCSAKASIERLKDYRKGTRLILAMECTNPFELENKIKTSFDAKFKLIAGNEFFEGDEGIMKEEFLRIKNDHDATTEQIQSNQCVMCGSNDSDDEHESCDEQFEEIKNTFGDYKEDKSFGGTKKLVNINIRPYENEHLLLECSYIAHKELDNVEFICRHGDAEYIKLLMANKIIENGGIYNLLDTSFKKRVNKFKTKCNNVILMEEKKIIDRFKECEESEDPWIIISLLFLNNLMINKYLPCTLHSQCTDSIYMWPIYIFDAGVDSNPPTHLVKLYQSYYDRYYLEEYLPYFIEYNEKEFYISNYSHKYMISWSYQPPSGKLAGEYKDISIFLGVCNMLWDNDENVNNKNYKIIIKKYNEITRNKVCLNLDENTKKLLSLQ